VCTMKLPRRHFLKLATGAVALPILWRTANAQGYPSRAVRIIVGFAPGGAADIVARLIGQQLSERIGQQFVIENRQGAGTNIATEMVVHAAPDGYTLLLITGANANNATLYDNLNFNFIRDIAPVGFIEQIPLVMAVNPSLPATTVAEFIAYTKARPGKISMGSGGNGSPIHMAEALFMMMTGVEMVHVPYRGEALALNDLLGGRVQVVFGSVAATLGYVTSGKVHALAVTTSTRSKALPDVPTVAEFVPGYEASAWHGIGAPKNTPIEIVDKLNRQIIATLADPAFSARLAGLGGVPMPMTPATFEKFIADETEKWAQVAKFAGIKLE
jgi:tripartite-type tricarboxylate transporter receptor subunit TctC